MVLYRDKVYNIQIRYQEQEHLYLLGTSLKGKEVPCVFQLLLFISRHLLPHSSVSGDCSPGWNSASRLREYCYCWEHNQVMLFALREWRGGLRAQPRAWLGSVCFPLRSQIREMQSWELIHTCQVPALLPGWWLSPSLQDCGFAQHIPGSSDPDRTPELISHLSTLKYIKHSGNSMC